MGFTPGFLRIFGSNDQGGSFSANRIDQGFGLSENASQNRGYKMPAVKQPDFNIEILKTVEALKKNPTDYEMILAAEDFITEGASVLEDEYSTAVQKMFIDDDGPGNPRIRDTALHLLVVWSLTTDKRMVMIHCQDGKLAAALSLLILATRAGEGAEDRAVAELFAQSPHVACDETLVGLFDDYLGRKGALREAWENKSSIDLNPFSYLHA